MTLTNINFLNSGDVGQRILAKKDLLCHNFFYRNVFTNIHKKFCLRQHKENSSPKSFFSLTYFTTRLELQVKLIPSLSEIKINERSLVKLYERTKTAITAPMYTASFFPGSRFPDVLREITSSIWINKPLRRRTGLFYQVSPRNMNYECLQML